MIGAAAAATAIAAGCGSDGDDGAGGTDEGSTTTQRISTETTRPAPDLGSEPFSLGVASGDPTSAAVILWTRLAPDPVALDGTGGMPAAPVEVVWEVAADEGFERLVAGGVAEAIADHGHAVHVDATGLEPGTDYWYRFRVGEATSPTGRTRTLPDGSPDRFAVAVANCQMYEGGTYVAYRHLLDEDVDLVAHLGDYIYEYPGGEGEGRHSAPNAMVRTLADYRARYGSYKADPDLAAAHARFPFVVTWDDHEVANNYLGDTVPGDLPPEEVQARKAAAYQAWWEHMPVRLAPPDGSDLAIYRSFDAGDLVRLSLLDERQDGDEPPCRTAESNGLDEGDCDAVAAEDRTRLGRDQEAWLGEQLSSSEARWNLLGNPVVLAGIDAGTDETSYYLDTWDGYPRARARLIEQLAAASNPVVLTGDYHAGMVLEVNEVPFDTSTALVAPELMAPPISSALFDADVSGRTPQLRQQINAHGYLTVEVTPDELTARFRTLDDVGDPDSAIATAATWTVAAGDPTPRQA